MGLTPERQSKGISYLSSVGRDGAGHNSLQVTAQTVSFHRDDSLLSQYCPGVERDLKQSRSKVCNASEIHNRIGFKNTVLCKNLLVFVLRVWFVR